MNRRIANSIGWAVLLLFLFSFRTVYGLCAEFWFPDERQIYLIGLKFFTTGKWPFFGPDIVYTQSQISGALQGLLVGLPLYLCKLPEAPAIFLNSISFGAFALFAWYLCKRFSGFPRWLLVIWIMTCPWAMLYTTKVVNPSYVLPFAILFFIGLFETYSFFETMIIAPSLSFFLMGLSTTAILQLHMSWVLLVPLVLPAFYFQCGKRPRLVLKYGALYFAGGVLGSCTLLPTLLTFGINGGGADRSIVFNIANAREIVTVLARFLSFASFEIPIMLGSGTASRLAVVKAHWWMAPFTLILLITGLVQVIFFIVSFFLKNRAYGWNRVRWFVAGAIALVYVSFFFSVKGPSSHTFYLMFPVAMLYSMYCYRHLFQKSRRWTRIAAFLLFCGFVFHCGLGLNNLKLKSLYVDRPLVVRAIEKKDYTILGLRRADEWGHGY